MFGDVEVDDAPAMVGEYDEDEEDAQAYGGHREDVERDRVADMVGKERPPGLGWSAAAFGKEPRDGALGDVAAEFSAAPHGCVGRPRRAGPSCGPSAGARSSCRRRAGGGGP